MPEYTWPVQWTGRYAVVTLPRDIDGSNGDQIREQLLWVINRGADVLVADMSGTASCDHRGADALARAYARAVANGTELRLVVGTACDCRGARQGTDDVRARSAEQLSAP
jgi:anti-anti-sigma regulatory factor